MILIIMIIIIMKQLVKILEVIWCLLGMWRNNWQMTVLTHLAMMDMLCAGYDTINVSHLLLLQLELVMSLSVCHLCYD